MTLAVGISIVSKNVKKPEICSASIDEVPLQKRSKQLPSHAGNQAFFENFSVLAHALGHPFPTLSGLIIVCARVDHVKCFSNSEAELVGRHGFVGVDSSAEQ